MAMSTVDAKRRVVIPAASPGETFDIQSQGEGRLLLVRVEQPKPGAARTSRARCLEAIAASPLQPTKSRSQMYSEAVAEYVVRHEPDSLTEQINAVCAEVDTRPDAFLASAARRVLERTEW